MSARPGDWSLLQLSGDPFPGDETVVSQQAGHYQNVADAISDQITNLRAISNGSAQGLYVDKLADDTKDLANDLSKVQNRFSTVASQLKVWQPVLAEGRSRSATLLREAETAHSTMAANKPPSTPLPSDAKPEQVTAEQARSRNYSSAQADLNTYISQMQAEISHVRSVARSVAGKISDASDDDVKDSWWDRHVREWIMDHAHLIDIIVKVLEIAAIVIAVVALVLATGGFGAFAALGIAGAWVGTAATVAEIGGAIVSGAILLAHLGEKDAGVNDVSWGDIALDVVSLATFGAGKLLSRSLSTTLTTATSSAVQRSVSEAVDGLPSTVKNALKITDASNPLRAWAAAQQAATSTAAREAVENALEVAPKLRLVLATGSTETAEALTKLNVLSGYPAAAALARSGVPVLRGLIAVSALDRLHFGYDLTKLPKTIKELVGGDGEEGGG